MFETADSCPIPGNMALLQAWISCTFLLLRACLSPPFKVRDHLNGKSFLGSSSVEGEGGRQEGEYEKSGAQGCTGGQGAYIPLLFCLLLEKVD